MTVGELIERLKVWPENTPVVSSWENNWGDYDHYDIEADDVREKFMVRPGPHTKYGPDWVYPKDGDEAYAVVHIG